MCCQHPYLKPGILVHLPLFSDCCHLYRNDFKCGRGLTSYFCVFCVYVCVCVRMRAPYLIESLFVGPGLLCFPLISIAFCPILVLNRDLRASTKLRVFPYLSITTSL